jgi:PASTA domain/FG-GAP-like repeat/Bacterial Ig-like domain (group 2)
MTTFPGKVLVLLAVLTLVAACGGGGSDHGSKSVVVPNVVGQTESAATAAIVAVGLQVGGSTSASSGTVPAGSVVSQNPTAGTMMSRGSPVSLVVSSGTPAQTVQSVSVAPGSASIGKGATLQLDARAIYEDGHSEDVTSRALWSSGTPSVATVSASGLVTALELGAATISARLGAMSGESALTVTAAVASAVSVTPLTASVATGGAPLQLAATATFTDGRMEDVTSRATWSVNWCATVTASGGLVTGITGTGECTATVTATLDAASGAAQVTVIGLFAPIKSTGKSVYRPSGVAIGDLTGDAKPDLVVTAQGTVASFSIQLWAGNGDGTFGAVSEIPGLPIGDSPVIADFDGDGSGDVAVLQFGSAWPGAVYRWLGDGTGRFSAPGQYPIGMQASRMAVADFNADNRPDLVVANGDDTVSILLGDAAGSFGLTTSFPAGSGPRWVAVGDFNGDARADIVVANHPSSSFTILLGTGTGRFGLPGSFAVPGNPTSVAAADFNADGKADVVVTHGAMVSAFVSDGTGSFQAAGDYAIGNATCVAVADFNSDGRPDLAVANDTLSGGPSAVLLGTGTGSFGTAIGVYVPGQRPNFLTVGDLNNDGKPDLVASDDGSVGSVSIVLHQ